MKTESYKQYIFLQNKLIKAQSLPTYKPTQVVDLCNKLIPLWDKLTCYEKNDAWKDYHEQLTKTNPLKIFAGVIEERFNNKNKKKEDTVWTSLYGPEGEDDRLHAELLVSEFTIQDQTFIQPGARFYWYVYDGRTILAMMKDVYTPEDIHAADEWAKKHFDWFK
jgi:hypothetical protein